ncbi:MULTISPECIES: hypothetical protein [unclassified Tolypothrix]|nr:MULTISPECIES: hypothetical protein [unclassified Tolypothrix]UYD38404.1 hypothetical protein HG267_37780 [Tolypothrix sp. PCC 7601]BAY95233.1 hypothetical protein NIES3275_72900 [Microchaete diplosiphon NIES-3275]
MGTIGSQILLMSDRQVRPLVPKKPVFLMTKTDLQAWLDRDDHELVDAIKSEIHDHVAKLHARGDQFYGYAILPGEFDTIHNLVVAFNRESDIAPENVTDSYYRLLPLASGTPLAMECPTPLPVPMPAGNISVLP